MIFVGPFHPVHRVGVTVVMDLLPTDRGCFRLARESLEAGFQAGRLHRIGIHPFAGSRNTAHGWTLQPHLAAPSLKFHHQNLPAGNRSPATLAEALVVDRMPEMEFVEVTQEIEFVFR